MHYHVVLVENGVAICEERPRTLATLEEAENEARLLSQVSEDWVPKRYPGRSWKTGEVVVYLDRRVLERRILGREVAVIRCRTSAREFGPTCYLWDHGKWAGSLPQRERWPEAPWAKKRLPDGAVPQHLDDRGNDRIEDDYRIEDTETEVIRRARDARELSPHVSTSSLVDQFIDYVGSFGVRRSDVLRLPLDRFIRWLNVEGRPAQSSSVRYSERNGHDGVQPATYTRKVSGRAEAV
jgi:hypothetical protein